MSAERLTVPEKLLLAALEARKSTPTFTAEDLVVCAWNAFPDTFGLSGYSDRYPDSNRVLTNIMGGKGMRGKGWLRKVGEKQYRLSPAGLSAAEELVARAESGPAGASYALRAELDRNTTAALARILSTTAAKKVLEGDRERISFNEVCGFWDITARSNAATLISRLEDISKLLIRGQVAADGTGTLRVGTQEVTKSSIDRLVEGDGWLQHRFKTELDIIRKRTDERTEKRSRGF